MISVMAVSKISTQKKNSAPSLRKLEYPPQKKKKEQQKHPTGQDKMPSLFCPVSHIVSIQKGRHLAPSLTFVHYSLDMI